MTEKLDIVIDIGGTKIAVGKANPDGTIDGIIRGDTPESEPIDWLTRIIDKVANGIQIQGIGISVPGPFDRATKMITNAPNIAKCWQYLPLGMELEKRYACDVVVENDANCAALAEAYAGAGKGYDLVVYYTISTGVGTGIVYRGNLLYGRHDTEGGHQVLLPHSEGAAACLCGGYGCLEALIGGNALALRHGTAAKDLNDQTIWATVGKWLGMALTNTTALLDPQIIIIGGGLVAHWEAIEPSLTSTMEELIHLQPLPPVRIESFGAERSLAGAHRCLVNSRM